MTPEKLYGMFAEALETEGVSSDKWDFLYASEQIAWGKLCRRLQREHCLELTEGGRHSDTARLEWIAMASGPEINEMLAQTVCDDLDSMREFIDGELKLKAEATEGK